MDKPAARRPTVLPKPLAMVMCDLIWRDSYSGKHSLLGAFDRLNSISFPFVYQRLAVYVLLTEGYGTVKLRLQMIDVDELRPPLVRIDAEQFFPDPMAVHESSFTFHEFMIPSPGEYRMQLFANDECITERRLPVFDTSHTVR